MKYDLNAPLDKARFSARVKKLLEEGDIVELRAVKPPRTMAQNRYLHVALGFVAEYMGASPEYVKQVVFKRLVCPDIFRLEATDAHLGRVEFFRSSRDLSVDELSTAIDRFVKWAQTELDITIPPADDGYQCFLAEMELERLSNQR